MTKQPLPPVESGFYFHYKHPDRFYFVIGTGVYRTDGDSLDVVYLSLYDSPDGSELHTRALWEWHALVEKPDYQGPRFTRVKPTPEMITEAQRRLLNRMNKGFEV